MTFAACARQALAGVSDEVRRDLAHDLADAVRAHFSLTVRQAETFGERGDGGWCDGVSIIDSGVILYRPTWSRTTSGAYRGSPTSPTRTEYSSRSATRSPPTSLSPPRPSTPRSPEAHLAP